MNYYLKVNLSIIQSNFRITEAFGKAKYFCYAKVFVMHKIKKKYFDKTDL